MTTTVCPNCKAELSPQTLSASLYICPRCGTYLQMPARERIPMLADPRTFKELDRGLVSVDPLRFTDPPSYRDQLRSAPPPRPPPAGRAPRAPRPAWQPRRPAPRRV